ncbi:hypothetical protein SDC9_46647 [bioreactor metagenome]|uniref:Uncharacterized protein n=1 Tax=bioreactor metagenome TaxID=1076179 RepID=A0A644WCY0_9ZZZZ
MKAKIFVVAALSVIGGAIMAKMLRDEFCVHNRSSITLLNGNTVIVRHNDRLSRSDRIEDSKINAAVKAAVSSHLQNGNPVARYDVKSKQIFLQYPDGSIKYSK